MSRLGVVLLGVALVFTGCSSTSSPAPEATTPQIASTQQPAAPVAASKALVPLPVAVNTQPGSLELGPDLQVVSEDPGLDAAAEFIAAKLRTATGFSVPVVSQASQSNTTQIVFRLAEPTQPGPEAYDLKVDTSQITITARTPAGAYWASQTLRQLLPLQIEAAQPATAVDWKVEHLEINDTPRYAYRGVMLDVTRRFAEVDEVKRFIDHAALYKFNYVHLHLSDDSGWRFEVPQYPELVEIGSQTQAGHPPGSKPQAERWHYTPAELAELSDYAAQNFMTLVPESDGPGHTLAAQASLGMLRCDGEKGAPYYGYDVNHPMICSTPENEANVRAYLEAVIEALVSQTDSPIIHLGGDEVPNPPAGWYELYTSAAREILAEHDRTLMAWHQWAGGEGLQPGDIMQFWNPQANWAGGIGSDPEPQDIQLLRQAITAGAKVVMSPADRLYLDMRYDGAQNIGLQWAARTVSLASVYNWDPDELFRDQATGENVLPPGSVLGVEAPLWTDRTYRNSLSHEASDLGEFIPLNEYLDEMAFPRLPAAAELAWTAQSARDYEDFISRLAQHQPRWTELGIGWYRTKDLPELG